MLERLRNGGAPSRYVRQLLAISTRVDNFSKINYTCAYNRTECRSGERDDWIDESTVRCTHTYVSLSLSLTLPRPADEPHYLYYDEITEPVPCRCALLSYTPVENGTWLRGGSVLSAGRNGSFGL